MTTAAQIIPPAGGLSFGWAELKMHYHCCGFKMAVFIHISTELKWLQIQRSFFFCVYTFTAVVILTKTNSGRYGRILRFLLAF